MPVARLRVPEIPMLRIRLYSQSGPASTGAVAISTLTRLLTYAATCVALPVLRRRPDAPPALFHAPGGMLTVAVALVVIAWLLASVNARELRDVGIAMVLGFVLLAFGRLGARRR